MSVSVKRIPGDDAQTDQTWLVLEGTFDGCPQVTRRRTVALAAIVAGNTTLDAQKSALVADVEAAYARYQALQSALEQL